MLNDTGAPRVCLVTGGTHGIGLATAVGLAKSGAHVIVAGRDQALASRATLRISRLTGSDHVETVLGDLSSQEGVRQVADQVRKRHPQLHVLVNNAGTIRPERELTVDGIEKTWAVNLLAPFQLTHLLGDLLRASAPARIVNVASDVQRRGRIDFDDLLFERRPYSMMDAYAQSKLALVMLTMEFASRWKALGITANSVHPGFIGSNFGRQIGGVAAVAWWIMRPFLTTPEKGAETSIFLAASDQVATVSGQYFVDCKPAPHNPLADDADSRARLWDIANGMVAPG